MNLGSFIVAAVLFIIVAAIVANMIKNARAGKDITGCSDCGGCGNPGSAHDSCACAEQMIKDMDLYLSDPPTKEAK